MAETKAMKLTKYRKAKETATLAIEEAFVAAGGPAAATTAAPFVGGKHFGCTSEVLRMWGAERNQWLLDTQAPVVEGPDGQQSVLPSKPNAHLLFSEVNRHPACPVSRGCDRTGADPNICEFDDDFVHAGVWL